MVQTLSEITARVAILENAETQILSVPEPMAFIRQSLDMTLDPWQRDVIESDEKRLLLLCARQVGKSQTAANLAAYRAVANPGINILLISPSLRQSRLLFDKVESTLIKSKQPVVSFEIHTRTHLLLSNDSSIRALPGTNADMVRGHTADLIVIDESAFINNALFSVILPMLGTTDGTLILLSTPSGPAGAFYDAWIDETSTWQKTKVYAEDCPRIASVFLTEAKIKLGEYRYRQEYGLEFLQTHSAFFDTEAIDACFDFSPNLPLNDWGGADSGDYQPVVEPPSLTIPEILADTKPTKIVGQSRSTDPLQIKVIHYE